MSIVWGLRLRAAVVYRWLICATRYQVRNCQQTGGDVVSNAGSRARLGWGLFLAAGALLFGACGTKAAVAKQVTTSTTQPTASTTETTVTPQLPATTVAPAITVAPTTTTMAPVPTTGSAAIIRGASLPCSSTALLAAFQAGVQSPGAGDGAVPQGPPTCVDAVGAKWGLQKIDTINGYATAIFTGNADGGVVWALVASGSAPFTGNPCTETQIPSPVIRAFANAGQQACANIIPHPDGQQ